MTEALVAFENQSIAEIPVVEGRADKLFVAGAAGMARDELTTYSNQRALDALRLGEALLASIEARHRLLYRYRAPVQDQMSGSDDDRDALVGCGKTFPWE